MHQTFVTLWLQLVQPLANVHETKWTPHVKRHYAFLPGFIQKVESQIQEHFWGENKFFKNISGASSAHFIYNTINRAISSR